jgi:hypothetical protein
MKANNIKLSVLVESILREEEDKKQIAAMDAAMGDAFKTLGAELEANKEEIQQDVEQSQGEINEALGVIGILGIILAAPKVVELFIKGIGKLVAVWKKLVKPGQAKGQEEEFAHNIIEFTHKWHKAYIKGLKWILKISGIFKKAGVEGDAAQEKTAEAIYYTIVALLAVYSGVGAVGAFKGAIAGGAHGGSFSLAALETAMAGIKSSEVAEFATKLGLKVA